MKNYCDVIGFFRHSVDKYLYLINSIIDTALLKMNSFTRFLPPTYV